MLVTFLVFASVIIVFLLACIVYIYPGKKNVTTVPGMDASDEKLGNFPDIQASGSMHQFLLALHDKHGPVASFWYGTEYCISIGNADLMKQVKHLFDRPAKLFEMVEPMIGKSSIQFANGEDGKRRHKLLVEAMSIKTSERLMPGLIQVVKELERAWSEFSVDEHVPLHEYMMALAIKMISKTQLGAFFKDDENVRTFHKHYMKASDQQEALMVGKLETEEKRKAWKAGLDQLHETVKEIIEAQKNAREEGDYEIAPLLDTIIDTAKNEKESGEKLSQELGDVTAVAVGGFHTTGTVLTWMLYYLTIHPDIQEKVQEELEMVLGENDLNEDTIKKLTYTWQVLEETLRYSITAPFAARVSNEKDLTIGGHSIPAGIPIVLADGVLLSDEKYFPNLDKFDPDRFSPENAKRIPAMAFPTFGVGARRCPGYHFSRYEVMTAVSILCKRYELRPAFDTDYFVEPNYGFVTKPETEIWIKLRKRY